jgi:signal peptidase II
MKLLQGAFCLILFVLDVVSKQKALVTIPHEGILIFDLFGVQFSLDLAFNTGTVWGHFQGNALLFFILRLTAIVLLSVYFLAKKNSSLFPWLLITGAIGNIVDFARFGYVVDFLHFRFWGYSYPIFNFADCYIVIGVFFLLFFGSKSKSSDAQDLPS